MKKLTIPLLGLITCSVSQANITFIDGAVGGGDFGSGTTIGTTGNNLSSAASTDWSYASTELDWEISGGEAVADSVAGTGLGQLFLKSDYAAGEWSGLTKVEVSFDWSTLAAGDTIEYALAGWVNDGSGVNTFGLANGSIITAGTQYGTGTSLLASSLVEVGSGASGGDTFSATIDFATIAGVTELADFDAFGIMFFSTVGSGGQVTVDNVALTAIPEPGSFALVAGLACLASVVGRRRHLV